MWGWSFVVPSVLVIVVGILVFLMIQGWNLEMNVEEKANSDTLSSIGFLESWRLPGVPPFANFLESGGLHFFVLVS